MDNPHDAASHSEGLRISALNDAIAFHHQAASIARAERRLILERVRKRVKAAEA